MRGPFAAVGIALCCLMLAPTAAAQEADEASIAAAARALFEEGIQLVDAHEYAEAADRFRRSMQLRGSPVVAFNLASVLAELGRLVEASELLRPIARAPDTPRRLRADAQSLLDALTPRIGSLTIHVSGVVEGVEVQLDGTTVPNALLGVARPVDPGSRSVILLRAGVEIASDVVQVERGAAATISLEAPAPAVVHPLPRVAGPDAPATVLEVPPAQPRGGSVLDEGWFWGLLGGIAVAGIVVAIVLAVIPGPSPFAGDFEPGIVEVGR